MAPATARSVTVPGLVTPGVTVTAALLLAAPLEAVMVAVPAATPATRPALLTVAAAGVLDVQGTGWAGKTVPAESFSVAASCTVGPTPTLAETGLTATEATVAELTSGA